MRALIGRDLHLKQAKSLLCQEQAPFLALHGLPGVGKTALAAAIVYETEIQQQFSDGIVWIGLGQKPRVLTHLSRLGILLNLNEKVRSSLRTHAQWLQALGHIIGMRRMLIVIDDAWSLEDVAACLVGGPACAYLLTTRLPEVAVCFAESHVVQVSELSQQEGVQLLQRFVPTLAEQESEALARLAQAVGGLPLALTLIGSYLLVRTYHQHSRRVQKALLHLQQVESRLLLEHPQTALVQDPRLPAGTPLSLHAVIRVSETVLDISSRCALAALSLFPAKPNTFSEEAALAVTSASVETLDRLVNSGLLEVAGGERYQLHQIIVDYAGHYLRDPPAEERMVAYFNATVQQHQSNYGWIEQEIANILTASQLALKYTLSDEVVQGTIVFTHFLILRGLYELAEPLLYQVEQKARQSQNALWVAGLLHQRGRIAMQLGQYHLAEQLWQEGSGLVEDLNDYTLISRLLYGLSELAYKQGKYSNSEQYLKRSLQLAYQTDDQQAIIKALSGLGTVAYQRSEYAAARAYYQEGLTIARRINDAVMLTNILSNTGAVAADQGDFVEASRLWQEAIDYARRVGDLRSLCMALANLGSLATEQEEHEQAFAYLREGLSLARQIGHQEQICNVLLNLGELVLKWKSPADAEVYLQEGLILAQQTGHQWFICELLHGMGELHLSRGAANAALEAFSEALKAAPEGDQKQEAKMHFGLARAYALLSMNQEAHAHAHISLQYFVEMGYYRAKEVQLWLERFTRLHPLHPSSVKSGRE